MQQCSFCGTDLPNNARFCGHCGHEYTTMPETATLITGSGVPDVDPAPDSSCPAAPTFTSNDSSPVSSEQEPLDENNESTLSDSKEDQATISVESRGEEEDDEEQSDLELSLPLTDQPDVWPHSALLPLDSWPIPVSSVRPRPATMRKSLPRLEASGCIPAWLTVVLIFTIILASVFSSFFIFFTPTLSKGTTQKFAAVSKQAKLSVSTDTLDFGKVEMGSVPTLSLVIGNTGGQLLDWATDVGTTTWLHLQEKAGTIEPGGPEQNIYVIADTNQLAVGNYAARLQVRSNGGDAQINVMLQVVASNGKKQAKLNVNPRSLDFGTLAVGAQAVQAVSVSKVGTQPLSWMADTGGTSWLKLDTNTGTIQTGDLPQTINVSVDTTDLPAGNYVASLNINSNGGSTGVAITLLVALNAPPPAPMSIPASPILSASLSGNTGCIYSANNGWSCTVSLSNSKDTQSNLSWSASSQNASFSPSSGVLGSGQSTTVTIVVQNIVCPNTIALVFSGPVNTVTVPWSCAAPTLSVSQTRLTSKGCLSRTKHYYICRVTLRGDQGGLNWSVSGSKGTSLNPQSGTVYPGTSVQVTIYIRRALCPTGITFTFTGPGNTVGVVWNC